MAISIKNLLETTLKRDDSWQLKLLSQWHHIMGNLSHIALLEKIDTDTLTLGVVDSCWMQELYLLTPMLLKTINEKLDQPRIKHLRFRKSGIKKQKRQEVYTAPTPAKKVTLNRAEQQALERVNDGELQNVLRQFLVRCYREK